MSAIYSVTQAMAWGITPQWVNATLNNDSGYQTSTKKTTKKNSWGTKTYTTVTPYYPTAIEPDGFTLENWNTYSDSTKGSKSNNTFTAREYGITTNSGAWVINYSTATGNWVASTGSTWTQISNTTGTSISASTIISNNTPTTQTYNVTLSQGVTNTSSSQLSNAWSNSTTLALGAQISAQYEAIGVEFSSTLTQSNTISGSNTTTQGTSDSQTISRSLSTPIPPGYTYEFVLQVNNSKASFGWSAPFLINTNDVHWSAEQIASYTMGAGDAANFALNYGYPSDALRYITANSAYGVFAGTSASNYNSSAQIQSYVVESSESDSVSVKSARVSLGSDSTSTAETASGALRISPRASINSLGFSIKTDRASRLLRGSNGDDRLLSNKFGRDGQRLKGRQSFALFEGNDIVSSYNTQDDVTLNLSGFKTITTRGGKDRVTALAPDQPVEFKEHINIDVGSGNDLIRFKDLSHSQLLSSTITLGSGKDTVKINLANRGKAQFSFTDLQPGKDRIILQDGKANSLRFEAAPAGQLIGYYNDTKLLHFRSDFLGEASSRYTLNRSAEKYEVALLNFGYSTLGEMPATLTDLFVHFAGQSATSFNNSNNDIYTDWKQAKDSDIYLKKLTRKVIDLGAEGEINRKDRNQLISNGLDLAASSSSVFEWVNGLEKEARGLGINLTLPSGF